MEFHLGLMRTGKVLEVNPVDLIAIEVLRLWEPDVFDRLRQSKQLLLANYQRAFLSAKTQENARADVDAILQLVPSARRSGVHNLLICLFPRLAVPSGEQSHDSDTEEWARTRRICVEDYFDRYFDFALRGDEISEAEIEYVRDHGADRTALLAHFESLQRRGLLRELLDRLEAYKQR